MFVFAPELRKKYKNYLNLHIHIHYHQATFCEEIMDSHEHFLSWTNNFLRPTLVINPHMSSRAGPRVPIAAPGLQVGTWLVK